MLFGSKSVEKILIFLFVNGKCYGTQVASTLKTALTPVQKALLRLENGGIIISYYEGKTRLYQFNPACPYLEELQQLLKKSYTLLPHTEKKLYHLTMKQPRISSEKAYQTLLYFWDKLASIKRLTFNAKSKSNESGWNGKGKGEVKVVHEPNALIFHEKGHWRSKNGQEIGFSNTFRWTLDRKTRLLSLEHLRHGQDHPVFLFHLAPSSQNLLTSLDSHFCEEDTYFGQVSLEPTSLKLSWRVIGPKKNEEIDYHYS